MAVDSDRDAAPDGERQAGEAAVEDHRAAETDAGRDVVPEADRPADERSAAVEGQGAAPAGVAPLLVGRGGRRLGIGRLEHRPQPLPAGLDHEGAALEAQPEVPRRRRRVDEPESAGVGLAAAVPRVAVGPEQHLELAPFRPAGAPAGLDAVDRAVQERRVLEAPHRVAGAGQPGGAPCQVVAPGEVERVGELIAAAGDDDGLGRDQRRLRRQLQDRAQQELLGETEAAAGAFALDGERQAVRVAREGFVVEAALVGRRVVQGQLESRQGVGEGEVETGAADRLLAHGGAVLPRALQDVAVLAHSGVALEEHAQLAGAGGGGAQGSGGQRDGEDRGEVFDRRLISETKQSTLLPS